jgi:UDPglucose 6-dehydrogenase
MTSEKSAPMATAPIAVFGATHLSSVVAGALASVGYRVNLTAQDCPALQDLKRGIPPVFEPDLEPLLKRALADGTLVVSEHVGDQLRDADLVYYAKDVIKTEAGVDMDDIIASMELICREKTSGFTMVISSQFPVGTCDALATMLNRSRQHPVRLAYVPEFLRLGAALSLFTHQDYTIIGCADQGVFDQCEPIFRNFSSNIFRMSLKEGEMAKHIANIFVATSVSLLSEMTIVADRMGIDLTPVGKALRFDKRIGPKAYILPGLGFTGGNLERDIKVLAAKIREFGETPRMLQAIVETNDHHNRVVGRRLDELFDSYVGKTIAFLGATYKPFTDTLVGSLTLDIGRAILAKGASVTTYDPMIEPHEAGPGEIHVCATVEQCIAGADAVVVMVDKPEFRGLTPAFYRAHAKATVLLDAANLYDPRTFIQDGFTYCAIGRGTPWSRAVGP